MNPTYLGLLMFGAIIVGVVVLSALNVTVQCRFGVVAVEEVMRASEWDRRKADSIVTVKSKGMSLSVPRDNCKVI